MKAHAKDFGPGSEIGEERFLPRADQQRGGVVNENDVYTGVGKHSVRIAAVRTADGLGPEAQQMPSERDRNGIFVVIRAASGFGEVGIHGSGGRIAWGIEERQRGDMAEPGPSDLFNTADSSTNYRWSHGQKRPIDRVGWAGTCVDRRKR
jgi:hypothetical protein